MEKSETFETGLVSWHWTDIVSTYRYWALVFAGFLVSWSSLAVNLFLPMLFRDSNIPMTQMGLIYSISMFGAFLGILLIVYFLRTRLKLALVLFAAITGMACGLLFYLGVDKPRIATILVFLVRLGSASFVMTAILSLVAARPSIKTFILVYAVVLIWTMISQFIAPVFNGPFLASNSKYLWVVGLPAILGALLLLPAKKSMFAEAPNITISIKPPTKRHPFAVFLLTAFIPFYALYWIFQRPAETKALAPDIRQPSCGGALCLALFAGFLLPVWFHDVRKEMGERVVGRSPRLLGFLTFFLGPVGMAMAQSDNNNIAERFPSDKA